MYYVHVNRGNLFAYKFIFDTFVISYGILSCNKSYIFFVSYTNCHPLSSLFGPVIITVDKCHKPS